MVTPVKIYKTDIKANIDTKIVADVMIKYPNTEISVCFDEVCELSKLGKNEKACYGDGKNFYFILKDKE